MLFSVGDIISKSLLNMQWTSLLEVPHFFSQLARPPRADSDFTAFDLTRDHDCWIFAVKGDRREVAGLDAAQSARSAAGIQQLRSFLLRPSPIATLRPSRTHIAICVRVWG